MGLVGAVERFVAVREGDLQQGVTGRDEVSLHTDASVGIVEAIGTDHLDRNVSLGTPRLGWSPVRDELGFGGRDRRTVEEGHRALSVGIDGSALVPPALRRGRPADLGR
jgi:hypothetical protein